ncbi:MAG TPA: metallophosphoesterase [Fimbriimonadaceae bacterium]|nr:metallophosphoesterase [Fimbriimonadaceae bacterium]
MNDIHLPSSGQNHNFKRLIRSVEDEHKADFIIFGGDNVFAIESADQKIAKAQLANWSSQVAENVTVPFYTLLGNHDLWGWAHNSPGDKSLARRMAQDAFRMPGRYYTFERGGWRFIILDSIQQGPFGYSTSIDEEQLSWLSKELPKTAVPTILCTHAPLLSVTGMLLTMPGPTHLTPRFAPNRLVSNTRQVLKLLDANANVKAVLSGHTHMRDEVKYKHARHVCAGAVCGAWWKGDYEGFGPTVTLVDISADGHFRHRFLDWSPG